VFRNLSKSSIESIGGRYTNEAEIAR